MVPHTVGQTALFPTTYARYRTDDLLAVYRRAPERLRDVIGGLTAEQRQARPISGKWAIDEIALHLVDSELIGATRIRLIFAQPGSSFTSYDEAAWANALDYQQQAPDGLGRALRLFELLREETTGLWERAVEADWSKTGIHPQYGEITLRNLLEIYADHGERHIGQILERRWLLGAGLAYPLLLQRRLY